MSIARATRLFPAPRDLVLLALSVFAFLAFALFLSAALGVPFAFPRGESPALRTSASAPFVVTFIAYVGMQILPRSGSTLFRIEAGHRHRILFDLALLSLFSFVLFIHFHIKMWVPLVNDGSFDSTFFAVDEQLRFLIEGLGALRAGLARLMPFPDLWYQAAFFGSFSVAFCFHSIGTRAWHIQHIVAITLVEVAGPLLYLAFPAIGPFAFESGKNAHATETQQRMLEQYTAMQEGGGAWLKVHGAEYLTAPLAAMPSLHVAATFVIAYYAIRARLVIAPLVVFAAGWIAIESIVTRWHYLVDVPVGMALAAVSIGVTNRLCRFRQIEDARAE